MARTKSNTFIEERDMIILSLLEEKGRITVAEISNALNISESTTRLQLQRMHDAKLLQRTRGGAVKLEKNANPSANFSDAGIINYEEKLQIATLAAKTVNDNDYIAISTGTTALLMSKLLHGKKNLTVITDSINVAYELLNDPEIRLYICGGEVRHRNGGCFGPTAENFLNTLQVDKSYSGIDSINLDYGITSIDIDPRAERSLCKCGRQIYILADHTKFKIGSFIEKTLSLDEIFCLISDDKLAPSYISQLKDIGVRVLIKDKNSDS